MFQDFKNAIGIKSPLGSKKAVKNTEKKELDDRTKTKITISIFNKKNIWFVSTT